MNSLAKRKVLKNKKIIVAVAGSVAAYKSIELVRELKKINADVRVIMTPSALKFVTPLSLEIASGNEVISDPFSRPFTHIELPQWADAMVIAPATANTLSKFFSASASDIVSACFLAFRGPVIAAPAMNWRMYTDDIFQERLDYLKGKGLIEVPPEKGDLACGEEGLGRMAPIDTIMSEVKRTVTRKDLLKKKLVITAGPTREHIDPVRYISNRSSGKMGVALAKNAFLRGADVTLISGPSCLEPPYGVKTHFIGTAEEMFGSVKSSVKGADVLIMAAAVADYKPKDIIKEKMDKKGTLNLQLVATADIISTISSFKKKPLIVGFAAETGDKKDRAREKLNRKNMDMVVFNDVSLNGSGFDVDTNIITLIGKDTERDYPKMDKDEAASVILDKISDMLS